MRMVLVSLLVVFCGCKKAEEGAQPAPAGGAAVQKEGAGVRAEEKAVSPARQGEPAVPEVAPTQAAPAEPGAAAPVAPEAAAPAPEAAAPVAPAAAAPAAEAVVPPAPEAAAPAAPEAVVVEQGKVPAGFPLAVMEGAKVQRSVHTKPAGEPETFLVDLTTAAPVADVAAFYEKALQEKGLTVNRSEQTSDEGVQVVLAGEAGKVEAVVVVARSGEQEATAVSVVWSVQP